MLKPLPEVIGLPPTGEARSVGLDDAQRMGLVLVECLRCGTTRHTADTPMRHAHPECPRCGYLGWAPVESLSESEREALRTRPPERRRLRLA